MLLDLSITMDLTSTDFMVKNVYQKLLHQKVIGAYFIFIFLPNKNLLHSNIQTTIRNLKSQVRTSQQENFSDTFFQTLLL